MVTALRTVRKISPMRGRSRSSPEPPLQPTTRLAGQPRFRSTVSNPVSSNDARRLGERLGIGSEQLRSDGVLVVVESQVAAALGFAHPREAVGGGEFRHQQPASGLLVGDGSLRPPRSWYPGPLVPRSLGPCREQAGMADEAPEHGVGDSGHGRQDGGRAHATDPRRTSAGTRASAGISCSLGLSQAFFTVNPLRGM